MDVFGVRLVGLNADTGHKLLLTLAFFVGLQLVGYVAVQIAKLVARARPGHRIVFWARQATSVVIAVLFILAILSIWFDNSQQVTTVLGLITLGLTVALQKAVTAFAGYLVILRGKTFTVGDRIMMGGVRGDVVALGFIQTRIMEMGQPPGEQKDEPSMWVTARQFTGRIVTVTNDKIFDEPVYNYTREFPFIWEEMNIPVSYKDDRKKAEQIIMRAAENATREYMQMSEDERRRLEHRYHIHTDDTAPHVYYRLTDNWIDLTVRFLVREHGVRVVKDRMSREIIEQFDANKIGIASGTYDIVGLPPVTVRLRDDGQSKTPA